MYLYFDSHGILKEVINDEAIRKGSTGNHIYIYMSGVDKENNVWPLPATFTSGSMDYLLSDETSLQEPYTDLSDIVIRDKIPFDKKRDLKYFKYGENYEFWDIEIPDSITLTYDGTVSCSLSLLPGIVVLGLIIFNIEQGAMQATVALDYAQYNYLLNKFSRVFENNYSKSQIDNLLNGKADIASTLAGYGINDAYTKIEVDTRIYSVNSSISIINDKIPSQASSSNKLVDRDTMNSSITQYASFFRGNYDTYEDLTSVEWQTADEDEPYFVSNNDYAVVNEDENHEGECWRYKWSYDETEEIYKWNAEYKVNNSAFTSDQEKAINSGITTEKRVGYDGLDAKKQNKVSYNSYPANPQEGDIVVFNTPAINKPLVPGNGIVIQEINGVYYANVKMYKHKITTIAYDENMVQLVFDFELINCSQESINNFNKLYNERQKVFLFVWSSSSMNVNEFYAFSAITSNKIELYKISDGSYFYINADGIDSMSDSVAEL